MKTNKLFAAGLSLLLLGSVAGAAFAGPYGHRVNERQERQADRIHQGIRSGELTRPEAHRLMQNEHQINRYERVARADGRISPKEHRRLERMQNHESHAIYHQKHDRQERH
jgi:hypothetical protein